MSARMMSLGSALEIVRRDLGTPRMNGPLFQKAVRKILAVFVTAAPTPPHYAWVIGLRVDQELAFTGFEVDGEFLRAMEQLTGAAIKASAFVLAGPDPMTIAHPKKVQESAQ